LWHLGFWQGFFLGNYIYSYNENWNAERKQGKVSFTDDNMIQAMSDMTDLWTNGYVNADWITVSDSEIPARMVDGKAAMVYHGNWMANTIKQLEPDFPLGAFLPKDREGRTVLLDEMTSIGLSLTTGAYANEKKRQGFAAFIRYLYSKDVYTEYLRMTRNTDITKQGIVYDEMKEFPLPSDEDGPVYKVRFMHEYWGEGTVTTEFRDWLWKLMQSWLLTGQPSIPEAMRQADRAFNLYHPRHS
jgi:raffinose/stachyose/melibiose transport system substrate-binding protein